MKDQVLDQLPEKIERVLRCGLSGFQKRIYNAIQTRSLPGRDSFNEPGAFADGGSGTSSGLNNAVMQLRKVRV